jgi:regulator of PEP synthase PpsR (kinase-PPPase family)
MQNKTAVQKLIDYMEENYHLTEESRLEFKKALEEEKQQIMDAWQYGMKSDNGHFGTAEDYYNSTYSELPTEPTQQKPTNHFFIGGCI